MGIQIYKGADTRLKFENFKDLSDDSDLTGATVTVSIYKKADGDTAEVLLGSPVTLTDNADADYYGIVPDDHADLEVGQRIVCKLSANGGPGLMCYKEADGSVITARVR